MHHLTTEYFFSGGGPPYPTWEMAWMTPEHHPALLYKILYSSLAVPFKFSLLSNSVGDFFLQIPPPTFAALVHHQYHTETYLNMMV